jgi:hemophore-related protein
MSLTVFARRVAVAVAGAGALILNAPTAGASPGCTVADMTGVEAQVAAAMTGYLVTHPEVNDFFTGLQGIGQTEGNNRVRAYFAANPQIKAEIDAIRGPAIDLRNRCNIPDEHIVYGVLS